MGDNEPRGDKETVVEFALLLKKITQGNQVTFQMGSRNQGIPTAEVVLYVEAWVDKIREVFKNHLKIIYPLNKIKTNNF